MNHLQCIRAFLAVADFGGFSLAANALEVSPSRVSSLVQLLEQHLGVTLLKRTTRTVSLTTEGERYRDTCYRLVAELDALEATMVAGGSESTAAGLLRVDVPAPLARVLICPLLSEFRRLYPQIEMQITNSENLFDGQQRGFDLMIRMLRTPPADSSLIARPISRTRAVYVASSAYLAARGEPKKPQDLLQHQCIGLIDPHSHRLWEWYFGGRLEASLRPPFELAFSDGELRLEAALKGMGIINELECRVAPLLAEGKLQQILSEYCFPASPIFLLYRRQKFTSSAEKAFIDFILEKYPPDRDIPSKAHHEVRVHRAS